MTNSLLNRSVVMVKTNKSGGAHAQGDVCIEDAGNANSVVNDNSGAYVDGVIWVCLEPDGVADNAPGLYACQGFVPRINLDGSAALGDFVKTSTTNKEGTPHAAPSVAGDFAQVLGTGANPAAVLFTTNQGGGGGGSSSKLIIIEDQKAQNTVGGSFNSGAWRTRDLNTIVQDDTGVVTVGSNQFVLPAGTYRARISAPATYCNSHQARLQNITDATTVKVGSSEYSTNAIASVIVTRSIIHVVFTIAGSKTFEVQHQCSATYGSQGFGVPSNFTTEVYTIVELEKIS